MNRIKLLITGMVIFFFIENSIAQNININFGVCTGNVSACNPFYPQFTCSNIPMRTMYGSPQLIDYLWDNQGSPTTSRVVKMTGTQKVINGVTENVDEGFEFEYTFKPYRNYVLRVVASGWKDNTGMTIIGKGEVILGSQYSTQTINGCVPDVFDHTKNNGVLAMSFTPTSYNAQAFDAVFQTTNATLARFKIRCANTSSDPVNKSSYLIIHSISIVEGISNGYNNCPTTHVLLGEDITWDYTWPKTSPYLGGAYGSWYSTTATANLHISNGRYVMVSNREIYLKPNFHAQLGPNGNIKIVIGRCADGEPLRSAPGEITAEKPLEDKKALDSSLYNKVTLFPNPVSTELNILLKDGIKANQIYITDNLGRKIVPTIISTSFNNVKLNTSTLKNGVYYLTLLNKGSSKTYKFIVNR